MTWGLGADPAELMVERGEVAMDMCLIYHNHTRSHVDLSESGKTAFLFLLSIFSCTDHHTSWHLHQVRRDCPVRRQSPKTKSHPAQVSTAKRGC